MSKQFDFGAVAGSGGKQVVAVFTAQAVGRAAAGVAAASLAFPPAAAVAVGVVAAVAAVAAANAAWDAVFG